MEHNLEESLRAYASSDAYAFHMPGHKRVSRNLSAEGTDLYSYDITEIDGFDNLHDPQGILAEEMAFAARLYGVRETYFLVGGSTLGILAAVSGAVPAGGRILIERACHISVYHAAQLRRLNISYIEDPWNPPARAMAGIGAVVLTSPTYEGAVRPVAAWAAYARQMGAILIVDEAHGAHLPFHPYFPSSAAANGADLVVQSLHKTLPALTQTALLHNVSGRVGGRKIQAFLDIYETSSPSYLLLASITATLHALSPTDADGREQAAEGLMDGYVRRLKRLRARLGRLSHYALFGGEAAKARDGEFPGIPGGTRLDPGKLVILCRGSLDGPGLYRSLRERFRLQPEMCGPDYVLCMTSAADTEEGCGRLAEALEALEAGEAAETAAPKEKEGSGVWPCGSLPPAACPVCEAAEAAAEEVPLRDAAGRVSAGYVLLYPPDAPLLVPGEVFTEEKIREICGFRERGLSVIGVDAGGHVKCTKIKH